MKWRIKSPGDKETIMRPPELVQMLFGLPVTEKPDHKAVIEAYGNALTQTGHLIGLTPAMILEIGFLLGYRYRVFLTKNNVTVEPDEATDEQPTKPTVNQNPNTDGSSAV